MTHLLLAVTLAWNLEDPNRASLLDPKGQEWAYCLANGLHTNSPTWLVYVNLNGCLHYLGPVSQGDTVSALKLLEGAFSHHFSPIRDPQAIDELASALERFNALTT